MLGVQPEIVTEGALRLQAAGLLDCKDGRIHVVDRKRLEARSFECYESTTEIPEVRETWVCHSEQTA
jgi:hypothetical protein